MDKVVLDTNCLIASLSKRGKYFQVWKDLHAGKYMLCVSNDMYYFAANKKSPL